MNRLLERVGMVCFALAAMAVCVSYMIVIWVYLT